MVHALVSDKSGFKVQLHLGFVSLGKVLHFSESWFARLLSGKGNGTCQTKIHRKPLVRGLVYSNCSGIISYSQCSWRRGHQSPRGWVTYPNSHNQVEETRVVSPYLASTPTFLVRVPSLSFGNSPPPHSSHVIWVGLTPLFQAPGAST